MRSAVVTSHRLWEPETGIPQEPFALSQKEQEPSRYEVNILVGGTRYEYGFALDATSIIEEWLYAWPGPRRQTWFRREGSRFSFSRTFHGENETIRGLTRPNSLFLSAAAQNNHPAVLPIFIWFQRMRFELRRARHFSGRPYRIASINSQFLYRLFDDSIARQASLFDDDNTMEEDRRAIVQMLKSADTGIVDLRVERDATDDQPNRPIRRANLYFRHKTDDPDRAWLPMEVESAGTVTLLDLATRLIPTLRTGGVLCIDEIESSLHPMLAGSILHQFCDERQNPNGAQLVFTTHDTSLLGDILGFAPLRRDQIWLTEKDGSGATQLYPLTDFHPRKQENLERGYLQGRYGGVPFLGDLLKDDHSLEPQ